MTSPRCARSSVYSAEGLKIELRTQQVFVRRGDGWTRVRSRKALLSLPPNTEISVLPPHASKYHQPGGEDNGCFLTTINPDATTASRAPTPDAAALYSAGRRSAAARALTQRLGTDPEILQEAWAALPREMHEAFLSQCSPDQLSALAPALPDRKLGSALGIHDYATAEQVLAGCTPERLRTLLEEGGLYGQAEMAALHHPRAPLAEIKLHPEQLQHALGSPQLSPAQVHEGTQQVLRAVLRHLDPDHLFRARQGVQVMNTPYGRSLRAALRSPLPPETQAVVCEHLSELPLDAARTFARQSSLTEASVAAVLASTDARIRGELVRGGDPDRLEALGEGVLSQLAGERDVSIRIELARSLRESSPALATLQTDPDPAVARVLRARGLEGRGLPPGSAPRGWSGVSVEEMDQQSWEVNRQMPSYAHASSMESAHVSVGRRMQASADEETRRAVQRYLEEIRRLQRYRFRQLDPAVEEARLQWREDRRARPEVAGSLLYSALDPEHCDEDGVWENIASQLSSQLEGNTGQGPSSAYLQHVVGEELGVKGEYELRRVERERRWASADPDGRAGIEAEAAAEEVFRAAAEERLGPVVRSWARAVAEETQVRLSAAGLDEVSLTRGMHLSPEEAQRAGIVALSAAELRAGAGGFQPVAPEALPMQTISSFSDSLSTAGGFAGGTSSTPRDRVHLLLRTSVSREEVWGTAMTGATSPTEGEMLLLGRPRSYEVLAVTTEALAELEAEAKLAAGDGSKPRVSMRELAARYW